MSPAAKRGPHTGGRSPPSGRSTTPRIRADHALHRAISPGDVAPAELSPRDRIAASRDEEASARRHLRRPSAAPPREWRPPRRGQLATVVGPEDDGALPSVPLNWDELTWPELVRGVESYREHFSRQAREDAAYLECYSVLRDDGSMLERVDHSGEIVKFLNAWACRLSTERAPAAIHGWIAVNAAELERLASLSLTDEDVQGVAGQIDELYSSLLFGIRGEVHNMSDAAASKVLHQLAPDLFVMWDKAIKEAALARGYRTYSDFLIGMHAVSKRLLAEVGMSVGDAETRLQAQLEYPVRKTFAKYIDEANWYWAVGRFSALHRAP